MIDLERKRPNVDEDVEDDNKHGGATVNPKVQRKSELQSIVAASSCGRLMGTIILVMSIDAHTGYTVVEMFKIFLERRTSDDGVGRLCGL